MGTTTATAAVTAATAATATAAAAAVNTTATATRSAIEMPGDWPRLVDAASAPYRAAGRFAWHFARAKLCLDPVFRHLLREGLIAPRARVLDIGCGQGLLASLLRAAGTLDAQSRWPLDWAAAPSGARVVGIELMPRDVARARTALRDTAEFVCGDMRTLPFPESDAVVLLDVLHYISAAEQRDVLVKAKGALAPGGTLLLRVGDAAAQRRSRLSRGLDAVVAFVRRGQRTPLCDRPLADWIGLLESLGFTVQSRPMGAGTPFANVLLVARREHSR